MEFILIDPQPIVLDPEAQDAVEKERLRIEQARGEAFIEELCRRKADEQPVVRTV